MTMTPEQQRSIIQNESAAFLDDGFGQLDLSQFPSLQPPPTGKSRDDGRFAKHWTDTPLSASAAALRDFVANPDTESLQRVADEIGQEEFVDEVRQRKGERIAQLFKQARPQYLPLDENLDAMVATMAFNYLPPSEQDGGTKTLIGRLIEAGAWDVSHLCAVFDALESEGILVLPAGEPRNLTEREQLRVARMAQSGRTDEAIGEYLRCALHGEEPTLEMVTDPAYRAVCDDAVLTVFEEVTLDYVPTPERKTYLLRHCGNRPLTLGLLQQAWRACQDNEQRHERGELLNQFQQTDSEPVSPKEIDALDDASVDRLYHDSLRAYAAQFRRAAGVLA